MHRSANCASSSSRRASRRRPRQHKRLAEIERRLAKAEREHDAVLRDRSAVVATVQALEREYRATLEREVTEDARQAHHRDFAAFVSGIAAVADSVRRDQQRRREAQAAGFDVVAAFGLPYYSGDLVDLLRQNMILAATGRDVDRGTTRFEGDELIVWRPAANGGR